MKVSRMSEEYRRSHWIISGSFCVAFLLAVNCLWSESTPFQVSSSNRESHSSAIQYGSTKSQDFEVVKKGELRDQDGIHLGATTYKAQDGASLLWMYSNFSSSNGAQEYLEKQVAKAVNVIKRSKITDIKGVVLGDRVEAIMQTTGGKESRVLLWTYGSEFDAIYSSSFSDTLALEKKLMAARP